MFYNSNPGDIQAGMSLFVFYTEYDEYFVIF